MIMREKMSISLISITSHYRPFSKTPLRTHTYIFPEKYRYHTVVPLLLDGQLHIMLDGLPSKFKGGTRVI